MTAGCPHAPEMLHWFAPRLLPGTADGADPRGRHAAQGGFCRRCRQPMLRTADVGAWSAAAPVADAGPLPPQARDSDRRRTG
jgi:hypothetical protein